MEKHSNRVTLIPRAQVFDEAQRRDLMPSGDRFDRFHGKKLIEALVPIKGSNQHGFTPAQAQRFYDLLTLCKQLGSKRPRASALAFWLCWHGATDVPLQLVCEHIERTLQSVLLSLRRHYERRRVPARDAQNAERWRQAGRTWAKPIIRELFASDVNNGVLLDAFATVIGLVLQTVFLDAPFDAVAGTLKRLMFLVGVKNITHETLQQYWNAAHQGIRLLTPDERSNAMLQAVRDINVHDPSEIIGLVHDTRSVVGIIGSIFPLYAVTTAPLEQDSACEVSVSMVPQLPPVMTALLAFARNLPLIIEVRRMLRAGEVQPVFDEFYQIKVIRDSIVTRIRQEQA